MARKHSFLILLESKDQKAIAWLSKLLETADAAGKEGNLDFACREVFQAYGEELASNSVRWVAKKQAKAGDSSLLDLLKGREEARCGRRTEG